MELKSDIICRGKFWYEVNQKLVGSFFDTLWGVFKTSLAIGILYDKQLEDDKDADKEEKAELPRTMFNRHIGVMQFFFQAAILSSNCVEYSEKDRLYLAFSEDIDEEELEGDDRALLTKGVSQEALNFDKIDFLKKFANYGITKIHSCISDNDNETMENLMEFLESSYKGETEELIKMMEIRELDDEEIEDLEIS